MKIFKTKEDEDLVRGYSILFFLGLLLIVLFSFIKFMLSKGITVSAYLLLLLICIFPIKYLFDKFKKSVFYQEYVNKIPIFLILIVDILGLIFINSKINF